jgi:hypothetical protein
VIIERLAVPLLITSLLSIATNAVLTGLWLSARDQVIEERGACNAAVLQDLLDQERIGRDADNRQMQQRIDNLERQAERDRESIRLAEETALRAVAGTAERDETITRLMLKAETDEIPDSDECLNVNVRAVALDEWVRVRNTDCDAERTGSGSGNDSHCAGPEGTDETDPAFAHFSDITYGDALKLWGRDRDIIQTLNGQLREIEGLADGS